MLCTKTVRPVESAGPRCVNCGEPADVWYLDSRSIPQEPTPMCLNELARWAGEDRAEEWGWQRKRTIHVLDTPVTFMHRFEGDTEQWVYDEPEINTNFVIQRESPRDDWDMWVHTQEGDWRADLRVNNEETDLGCLFEMMADRILIEWLGCDLVTQDNVAEYYRDHLDAETLRKDLACVRHNSIAHNPGATQVLEEMGLIAPNGRGWLQLTQEGLEKLGGRYWWDQLRRMSSNDKVRFVVRAHQLGVIDDWMLWDVLSNDAGPVTYSEACDAYETLGFKPMSGYPLREA